MAPQWRILAGKSHGQRSLVVYRSWGRIDSDRTQWLHIILKCFNGHLKTMKNFMWRKFTSIFFLILRAAFALKFHYRANFNPLLSRTPELLKFLLLQYIYIHTQTIIVISSKQGAPVVVLFFLCIFLLVYLLVGWGFGLGEVLYVCFLLIVSFGLFSHTFSPSNRA